jgi:Protein of unknown function (DUF664)
VRRPGRCRDGEPLGAPVEPGTDLEVTGDYRQGGADAGSISLREVMVHMIEEYARHLGHADFLRERIDGRVGQ